jgi:hypothetical protein
VLQVPFQVGKSGAATASLGVHGSPGLAAVKAFKVAAELPGQFGQFNLVCLLLQKSDIGPWLQGQKRENERVEK